MTSNVRRSAALAVAGVVAAGALQVGSAIERVDRHEERTIEQVASVRFGWPWRTTTTVRRTTTTTKAPTTTTPPTTAAPVTTAAPPTTKAPTTTTTKAPTTTQAPVTTQAPAPTQAPVTTVAPAPVGGNLSATTQNQMLAMVNARRASGTTCGGVAVPPVPALALSGTISRAADAHAVDMATYDYFSHTGRDGSDPGTRLSRAGYRWSAWAENIAAGQTTATSVVDAWFGSAGHCKNFMSSAVTQIGFGMAQNPASSYKIYWVSNLARPA